MPDPELFRDWKVAKHAAGALAHALHMTIGQGPGGEKLLFLPGKPPRQFPTWLSLWTYLYRLRCDQIAGK
jgi:hypothetical protein